MGYVCESGRDVADFLDRIGEVHKWLYEGSLEPAPGLTEICERAGAVIEYGLDVGKTQGSLHELLVKRIELVFRDTWLEWGRRDTTLSMEWMRHYPIIRQHYDRYEYLTQPSPFS